MAGNSAKPILDTETTKEYGSESKADKDLYWLVAGDPEDQHVWFKIQRRFPDRFRTKNPDGEWVALDDPSIEKGSTRPGAASSLLRGEDWRSAASTGRSFTRPMADRAAGAPIQIGGRLRRLHRGTAPAAARADPAAVWFYLVIGHRKAIDLDGRRTKKDPLTPS